MRALGTPLVIHQPSYSLLNRWIEPELLDVLEREGMGCIAFSPLAQGMLSDRYLDGVPAGSRAAREGTALERGQLTEETLDKVRALNELAAGRGQSLSQLALAWTLRDRADDLDRLRRVEPRAAGGECRRPGAARLHAGRAGGDRPARDGERPQPVGALERELDRRRTGGVRVREEDVVVLDAVLT